MSNKSDQVILSAPMSYLGSASRIMKFWRFTILKLTFGIMNVLLAWALVTAWYVVFGLWLVPYRLLRRSQRREKRDRMRHEETLRALQTRA